ncbi:MAG: gamma-glutamyltransferase [Pirellulales bacterium]
MDYITRVNELAYNDDMKCLAVFVSVVVVAVANARGDDQHWSTGSRGMVATVHPLATEGAVNVMRRGGNAVDGAVAAALILGVVDPQNSGIGGGCFILIRLADGEMIAIDGRETAPAAAHRDMYLRNGQPQQGLSQTGPLAAGTPGALAAYERVVRQYGKTKFKDMILSAAKFAENGFKVSGALAARLKATTATLSRFKASRVAFLKGDSQPYRKGETLKLSDLAATYREVAKFGTAWFYSGPFADQVDRWMKENGGILTAADFKNYRTLRREPVISTYRGLQIVGFPPPSSGGVHVAQILNILENFDLKKMDDVELMHVVAEAMKLAFADRAHWLGDADFVKVPRGLVDKAYAKRLAQRIDLRRATKVAGHGTPDRWQKDVFKRHTTHISAADAAGNWVAITTTVNTSFGSKVTIPKTGVVLNNQMDDFSIAPGAANAFGLVGAEANAIAPLKRPLSSMSPTVVLKDGRPVMTLGAAGGPTIISQVVLTIVKRVDGDLSLRHAVAHPRIHHQWLPDRLFVESAIPADRVKSLALRGHKASPIPVVGRTQAIGVRGDKFIGVADPRRADAKALGF